MSILLTEAVEIWKQRCAGMKAAMKAGQEEVRQLRREKIEEWEKRRAVEAERDALQDRLEMRHAYDGAGNRIEVEPGSIPDGIECRDATIKGLEERVARLRAEIADYNDERTRDLSAALARAEKTETALRAIIARADNNEPGTSKVQDMKRIAVEALGNEVAK